MINSIQFNTSKRDFWKKTENLVIIQAPLKDVFFLLKTCLDDIFTPSS